VAVGDGPGVTVGVGVALGVGVLVMVGVRDGKAATVGKSPLKWTIASGMNRSL
jgi:hypothetical protein